MKEIFFKFMCFLTGHNHVLARECSEKSKVHIKKYFSALLMIIPIWAFIGYNFVHRYLKEGVLMSIVGALFMAFLIWQIERQIILADKKSRGILISRGLLAVVASILGAIIIDQIILTDDIEKKKIEHIQEDVNRILPNKTKELDNQIAQLDEQIQKKEQERAQIMEDINKRPMITTFQKKTKKELDEESQTMKAVETEHQAYAVENPKLKLIPEIENQINKIIELKRKVEDKKINIRELLEKDLTSKTGFLQELNIVFEIIFSSVASAIVWGMIFLFFFFIEMFVLVNKWTNELSDYDELIKLQETLRKVKMNILYNGQNSNNFKEAMSLSYAVKE